MAPSSVATFARTVKFIGYNLPVEMSVMKVMKVMKFLFSTLAQRYV